MGNQLELWVKDYVQFRAATTGTTIKALENPKGFKLVDTDGATKECYFLDHLEKEFFEKMQELQQSEHPKRIVLIEENKKEVVLGLIPLWDSAKRVDNLMIMFVDVVSGEKWIIKPALHDKICQPDQLEKSLLSLMKALSE